MSKQTNKFSWQWQTQPPS